MNILSFFKFCGGLGLLLYGIGGMGDALERLAGERLEKTLEKMTGNIFKSVLLGALVTAVIQSSTGTTVMVVGFVNAGIMNLNQAVGIIMGANIGTTVTTQMLRLDSSGGGSAILGYLKPSVLCYVIVAAGAIIIMTGKKKKTKTVGDIFVGIGLLFLGMSIMESSVAALQDNPAFEKLFITLQNPLLAMLVGAVVTAILHSSAASVGILQAAAATGMVTYAAAIPIIMGQNIGTCVTALVSSLGGNKNARRAAIIHFYFNLIGSVIFIAAIYGLNAAVGFSFWEQNITKGAIANFHTLFNVTTTMLFLPFSKVLVWLAEHTIKDKGGPDVSEDLAMLDTRFYDTPAVALDQCYKVVCSMNRMCMCNFLLVTDAILENKPFDETAFRQTEELIDRCEARLNAYMIGIKDETLSVAGKRTYAEIMHAIGDFERIGDYAENLMDQYLIVSERSLRFSKEAEGELKLMRDATLEILQLTGQSYENGDKTLTPRIEALEDILDTMKESLKSSHISRLQSGACTVQTGIPFLDIIHNFEKISDHCASIAVYVAMAGSTESFDVHEYRKLAAPTNTDTFKDWIRIYEKQYLAPLPMSGEAADPAEAPADPAKTLANPAETPADPAETPADPAKTLADPAKAPAETGVRS